MNVNRFRVKKKTGDPIHGFMLDRADVSRRMMRPQSDFTVPNAIARANEFWWCHGESFNVLRRS